MKTKTELCLLHLREKGSLTSWQAIELYGNTRLSDTIFKAKKKGYNIRSVNKEANDRNGHKCKFVEYVLISYNPAN